MSNEELAQCVYRGQNSLVSALYDNCYGIILNYINSSYRRHFERYRACGIEREDLFSECYFVLLDAVKAYCEQTTEYKFVTFLKYPMKNRFNALLGYRTDKTEPLNQCSSLDMPLPGTEDLTFGDTIEDKDNPNEDDITGRIALGGVFPAVRDIVTPCQYDVLERQYRHNSTFDEIACVTGLTVQDVKREKRKALDKLRKSRNKDLKAMYDDIIGSTYNHSSLKNFRRTWTSAPEWAVIQMDKACRDL